MTAREIVFDILQQYRDSIIHNRGMDLEGVLVKAYEKAMKSEYKRGYKVAKEKFRNANTSDT